VEGEEEVKRAPLVVALAILAALVATQAAAAHTFYVDANAAATGDCITETTPCKTIAEALSAADPDVGSPDQINVRPGTYTENVVLNSDRSLISSDVSSPAGFVLAPSDPGQPTVSIEGMATANVVGFEIIGPMPVVISAAGRANLNKFPSSDVPAGGANVTLIAGAENATVDQNAFADDGVANDQAGVSIAAGVAGSPSIRSNRFLGLERGIDVKGTAGAELASNVIARGGTGVSIDTGTVDASNLTVAENTTDVSLGTGTLNLDSSIVQDPIDDAAGGTCNIIYSAGPAIGMGSCEFQLSNTNPGFVDPANGDYHLTAGSPLIDVGNPALPSGLDLDLESRGVDGNCDGTEVRDVGADELAVDCPPPPDPPPPPPPPPPAKDTAPPETSIDRKKVGGRTVVFRFSSSEQGSTFLCRLDRKPYRSCESPTRYQRLDDGRHTFRVKARDAAGNEDAQPARKRFRISEA
jgi:hypothetical protein